jgi:hypothetical protein
MRLALARQIAEYRLAHHVQDVELRYSRHSHCSPLSPSDTPSESLSVSANLILTDTQAAPPTYSVFFGDGSHLSGVSILEAQVLSTEADYAELEFDVDTTPGFDRIFLERSSLLVHKVTFHPSSSIIFAPNTRTFFQILNVVAVLRHVR